MKICLYSPYIPKHFGGGEKYFFDVARLLAEKHEVVVAVPENLSQKECQNWKEQYETFFQRSFANVTFQSAPLHTGSAVKKALWTRQFDVCLAVTDGSLFFSSAKKNILHIQVPFTSSKTSLPERLKLNNWPIKNANSQFTRSVVENAWHTKIGFLHYPAVDDECFQPIGKKQNIILNVGRFFRQLHSKRQDILVQAFAQLCQQEPKLLKNWKLVLIGSVEDQSYVDEIQQLAKGLPVEFYHSASRQELLDWYKKASIYWHAAGFNIDQEKNPEKVEHFGISTAEAMAAGCLPIVVGKGGQVEVLGEKFEKWQWQTIDQCVELTTKALQSAKDWPASQEAAATQAHQFSTARFKQTLYEMIEK
jgi:glycosyltransferase involved in cell wall biosynthesis